MERVELVRNDSIRVWSLMRCNKSPIILESKNAMGSRNSFIKKSEISDTLHEVISNFVKY